VLIIYLYKFIYSNFATTSSEYRLRLSGWGEGGVCSLVSGGR